jgi:Glycosyltransferase family 87
MKKLLSIIAATCIILFCTDRYYDSTIARRLPTIPNGAPCDFLPYYQAAQHIARGESPFLADGYIYPPLLAFMLTPLAWLDYPVARSVWFAISQLFLVASAILLWRAFGRDWASACLIAFVWAFGGAAGETLAVGQVALLLMLSIVVALCCRRCGAPGWLWDSL